MSHSEIERERGAELQPGSIVIDAVTKRFRKFTARKRDYTTVKSSLLARFFGGEGRQYPELIALRDFNLRLEPGSAVGIIGKNGSGKSTLLKLIAGIYHPDGGSITVAGRVSALIELGAGFHPEFTGRENVYLGGAMYGMTRRQIDERFDAIVRYAELEDFIDDPVRTYSSGMYMRLGFSVAICCDPDVLLIDEVLAVGDASFVHRCYDSISEFKRRGKTLVLVTHDLDSVERWCDEAVWLEKGVMKLRGEPRFVIDSYLEKVFSDEERNLEEANASTGSVEVVMTSALAGSGEQAHDESTGHAAASTEEVHRWGSREVEIAGVSMVGESGDARWIFSDEDAVEIVVNYDVHKAIDDLVFGVGILRVDGLVVHGTNTEIDRIEVPIPDDSLFPSSSDGDSRKYSVHGEYRYRIERLGLTEGSYYLDVAAHRRDGTPFDYHHRMYKFSVKNQSKIHGVCNLKHSWALRADYPSQPEQSSYRKKTRGTDQLERTQKLVVGQ